MEKIQHYLFDFDGTLVDSMPFWAKAMLNVLQSHDASYPENVINIITPMGLTKTCEYFLSLGIDGTVDSLLAEIDAQLTPMYAYEITAKAGVAEKLKGLKAEGIGLHVLTASPHRWLDVCLKRNGLYDLFGFVWSCEDFPTTKTDPQIYRLAAGRIGADIRTIAFLDDNINAVTAAAKSGIRTVGVFDETSRNDRPLFDAVCDRFITSFYEL